MVNKTLAFVFDANGHSSIKSTIAVPLDTLDKKELKKNLLTEIERYYTKYETRPKIKPLRPRSKRPYIPTKEQLMDL